MHWTEKLKQLEEQFVLQNDDWQRVRRAIESTDSGTLFAVTPNALSDFEDACSADARPHVAPRGAVRA